MLYQPLQELTHVLGLAWKDSHGAALASGLSAVAWDRVVRKGADKDADALSPFRDLHGTDLGLAAYLREHGVQARCPGLPRMTCRSTEDGHISLVQSIGAQLLHQEVIVS